MTEVKQPIRYAKTSPGLSTMSPWGLLRLPALRVLKGRGNRNEGIPFYNPASAALRL